MGRRRNDSSTIRATPSASGEPSKRRNFSINSSARSDEVDRIGPAAGAIGVAVALAGAGGPSSITIGVDVSKSSSGTPSAREILLKVPAWGLLVLPRSIW